MIKTETFDSELKTENVLFIFYSLVSCTELGPGSAHQMIGKEGKRRKGRFLKIS